jgi:Spy/CpxP family protein refolding chaperone
MKTNKFRLLATIIAALLISINTNVLAQRGQGGPGMGQGMGQGSCMNIPDLTDAQKTSLDKLRASHQKEMLQFRNEMGELKAKLQTLRTAESPNMTEINATVDKITALKNKQMKSKESHTQEVRKVLTPEQRVQFDLHQGKGKGKGMMGQGGGRG